MEFSTSQSMAVDSSLSAAHDCGANMTLVWGSAETRVAVTRNAVIGGGRGRGWPLEGPSGRRPLPAPPWSVCTNVLSPKGSHQDSVSWPVLSISGLLVEKLKVSPASHLQPDPVTLWTASHPSTPALCSEELVSSAHPLGHSPLFAPLKGEFSEGGEQKGFRYT